MIAVILKLIIVLLNFAFKCRLVNQICAIALVQAGTQVNQLASAIDCAGNITNFTKNCTSKSFFFFSRFKRDVSFNFCVCHKKGVSGIHPIPENNTYYVCFHYRHNRENKLLLTHAFFLRSVLS